MNATMRVWVAVIVISALSAGVGATVIAARERRKASELVQQEALIAERKTEGPKSERDPGRDSLETYKDLTKLLISLATGTLVFAPPLAVMFRSAQVIALPALFASASLLVTSLICGILTLSTLAGSQHAGEYDIDYYVTRLFAVPQWVSFVAGLVGFSWFGFSNLRR